jgi:ribulose-phosphate 3-epimerase
MLQKNTFAQTTQTVKTLQCTHVTTKMKNTLIAPSVLLPILKSATRHRNDQQQWSRLVSYWHHGRRFRTKYFMECQFWKPLTAIKKNNWRSLDDCRSRPLHKLCWLGANILSVHYEACTHLHRTLQAIKAEGMKAGSLSIHILILLEDVINDVDLVCIMSVNPGFGGQSFMKTHTRKVEN